MSDLRAQAGRGGENEQVAEIGRRTRRQRKQVEMLFAHMKRVLKMDRLRLRGLTGANDEFLLAATVQNLRQLAKASFKPPDHRASVPG